MFKRMYLLLFNRITDAIKAIERGDSVQARTILIRAQQDTEALYMEEKTDTVMNCFSACFNNRQKE